MPTYESKQWRWRHRYRTLLVAAEIECPQPNENQRKEKRGRLKRSKGRNLLERLRDFEYECAALYRCGVHPFTNNQGENDLRITKVQQKISGCLRSLERAMFFYRVRSYLSTCRKHGVTATQGLTLIFQSKNPDFMERNKIQGG